MKQCGLQGTLINHSECRVSKEQVAWVCERARKVGFDVCVCAKDVPEAVMLAQYHPSAIAVEPPELIGSGISVSSANPEIVSESVAAIKKVSPSTLALVGAGVSNAGDVATSLKLGAEGVLLASAYVKAKDPEAWLRDVAKELV
jgi:triosephosphate isomerase